VTGLPASFTGPGYDVYVYGDSANQNAASTTNYALGGTTIGLTDMPGVDFLGAFLRAGNSIGNYVVFPNQNAAGFTLTATPGSSADGVPRAPINSLQIVRHTADIPPALVVTIDSVSTGLPYATTIAAVGAKQYIDRSVVLTKLSAGFSNGVMIQTALADRSVQVASHLTFSVNVPATVYVCYDKRAIRLPAWLQSGWNSSGETLSSNDPLPSPYLVFCKNVPAGQVTLGGNLQSPAWGVSADYTVIVTPQNQ
jgi:hypothetical protein